MTLYESVYECQGHPAGPFDPMGETTFCDGSCVSIQQTPEEILESIIAAVRHIIYGQQRTLDPEEQGILLVDLEVLRKKLKR